MREREDVSATSMFIRAITFMLHKSYTWLSSRNYWLLFFGCFWRSSRRQSGYKKRMNIIIKLNILSVLFALTQKEPKKSRRNRLLRRFRRAHAQTLRVIVFTSRIEVIGRIACVVLCEAQIGAVFFVCIL